MNPNRGHIACFVSFGRATDRVLVVMENERRRKQQQDGCVTANSTYDSVGLDKTMACKSTDRAKILPREAVATAVPRSSRK